MVKPRHNQPSFFKYYTAESAIKTLLETTQKWSSPKLFNDPFDNQFNFQFEEPTESVARQQTDELLNIIASREPIRDGQFGTKTDEVRMLQRIFLKNQPNISTQDREYVSQGVMEGMHNQIIHEILSDTSIFCVSETNDNILMWSHYTDNHTGAVIEFHAQLEDSAFLVAQRVRYESTIPVITLEMVNERRADELFDMVTLTKSTDWEYEKEWRVVTTMHDKSRDYEILRFPPEEVAAVYLGCRITDECKREIIEIVKDKYPDAKIYQAHKHEREFSLVFELL